MASLKQNIQTNNSSKSHKKRQVVKAISVDNQQPADIKLNMVSGIIAKIYIPCCPLFETAFNNIYGIIKKALVIS